MNFNAEAESTHINSLSFLWLEITEKCNLSCIHCYADSGPQGQLLGQMRFQDWLRILQEGAGFGCKQVQFIGGEPTLHPDLPRLIGHASDCAYDFIEVFTNATRLSGELLDVFSTLGVHIAASFYSADREVHERITKRKGSYDRTIEGIKRILGAGLDLRVGIIEMEENEGQAPLAKEFLIGLGVKNIGLDFQRGIGRGSHVKSSSPMSELCGQCWKGTLCVTSNAVAYPCVFARFKEIGNIRNGIASVIEGADLISFRGEVKELQSRREQDEMRAQGSCWPCSPSSMCNPTCNPSCGPSKDCSPNSTCWPCAPSSFCKPTCSPGCGPHT
jgi:MoaA/NifB/PqqE/SkfB family radical SAM enzyme